MSGVARIRSITLYRASFPLREPYKIALTVFHTIDPFIAEVRDEDGRVAWAENVVTEGYGHEIAAEVWQQVLAEAALICGLSPAKAMDAMDRDLAHAPGARCVLYPACEQLAGHEPPQVPATFRQPLLAPIAATQPDALRDEVESLLARGFRTVKQKVGFDVDADLTQLRHLQHIVDGRATIRLDANQGYDLEQAKRFAASLEPTGIALFEQPCHMDDWAANAAVAAVSRVPVMLDESIFGIDDVERAASISGVGFVKLKLKKLGGMRQLATALTRIRELGLVPILGDGASTEITGWQEAQVARRLGLTEAGENNGFQKMRASLLRQPLTFEDGALVLKAGDTIDVDPDMLARHTLERHVVGAA